MTDYRRFLSYIYAYDGDYKMNGTGFAKMEVRDGRYRLTVNLNCVLPGQGRNYHVAVYGGNVDAPAVVDIGEIEQKGSGGYSLKLSGLVQTFASGRISLEDAAGLVVFREAGSRVHITSWKDPQTSVRALREEIYNLKNDYEKMGSEEDISLNLKAASKPEEIPDYTADLSKNVIELENAEEIINAEKTTSAEVKSEQEKTDGADIKTSTEAVKDMGAIETHPAENPELTADEEIFEIKENNPALETIQSPEMISELKMSMKSVSELKMSQEPENILIEGMDRASEEALFDMGTNTEKISEKSEPEQLGTLIKDIKAEPDEADLIDSQLIYINNKNDKELKSIESLNESTAEVKNEIPDEMIDNETSGKKGYEETDSYKNIIIIDGKKDDLAGLPEADKEALSEEEKQLHITENGELWHEFKRMYPKIRPFDEKGWEILQIKLQDIGRLCRENWILGNNNFVLHGYYKYGYLILARKHKPDMDIYILGVPGTFSINEKFMASMFGMTDFMQSNSKRPDLPKNFGYWCTHINM